MINEKTVENLTKAYICSFNVALNEVHNPNMAGQVAAAVLISICSVTLQNQQQDINLSEILMMAIQNAVSKNRKNDTSKKNEKTDDSLK